MKRLFKNKRINILIVDGMLALLALFAPAIASLMINNIPSCAFAKMGILCPACGGTRCVESFFSGRIGEAFSYNAFFTVLIFYSALLLIIINLYCLFDLKVLKNIIRLMSGYKTIIAAAVLFAVFGFIRAYINIVG